MSKTYVRIETASKTPQPVPELFGLSPRKAISAERARIKKRLEALDLPLWWRLWLKGVEHDPWVRDSEPITITVATSLIASLWTIAIGYAESRLGGFAQCTLFVLGVLALFPITIENGVTWGRVAWRWFLAAAMPLWLIAVLVAPKLREYGAKKFEKRSDAELKEARVLRYRSGLSSSELLQELYKDGLEMLSAQCLGPDSRFGQVKAFLTKRFASPVPGGVWRADPVREQGVLADLTTHEQEVAGIFAEHAKTIPALVENMYAHPSEREIHLGHFQNDILLALTDVERLVGEEYLDGVLKSVGLQAYTLVPEVLEEPLDTTELFGLASQSLYKL